MVVIKKLSVENFRSHTRFGLLLSPTITVITGMNGSGKTSLIEALYIALQGGSFKGADGDVLRNESPWWRIEVTFNDDTKRLVTFDPNLTTSRKKFVIDGKTMSRLPSRYKYPVVLFEPDDLRLLHGSPTRRRQFIDRFIGQLDPMYLNAIHKYDRALKQRNNLLKRQFSSPDERFIWEVALSEYGSYIIEKRIAFIEQINNNLNDAYNNIAKSKDIVSMHYSHTYIGNIRQKLLNDLHNSSERDAAIGFTSVGPHRHDVIFQFNGSPALDIASRGEVRSIVLALKFLEIRIIEQITGQKPIVLLDDVFSELDDDRQKSLLTTGYQVIITSTKLPSDLRIKIKNIKLQDN